MNRNTGELVVLLERIVQQAAANAQEHDPDDQYLDIPKALIADAARALETYPLAHANLFGTLLLAEIALINAQPVVRHDIAIQRHNNALHRLRDTINAMTSEPTEAWK